MIALDVNLSPVRASAVDAVAEAIAPRNASEAGVRLLERGSASEPITEWFTIGSRMETSALPLKLPLPDLEWTKAHEHRFALLAGKEAASELTPHEELELERLAALRRRLRNPRLGEELVWEYEQRELTHDLIRALDRYVSFHKAAHRP